MINDMNLDSINLDSVNLEEIWSEFKSCVLGSVDKHAPEKLSKSHFRDSWPWYNQELQVLKTSAQNRKEYGASINRTINSMHSGNITTKYIKILRTTRMMYTQNKITKFKGNSKHLHKLN